MVIHAVPYYKNNPIAQYRVVAQIQIDHFLVRSSSNIHTLENTVITSDKTPDSHKDTLVWLGDYYTISSIWVICVDRSWRYVLFLDVIIDLLYILYLFLFISPQGSKSLGIVHADSEAGLQ